MGGYFRNLPFSVVLLFAAAGAMLVPSVYGLAVRDHDAARVFFYTGILVAILAMLELLMIGQIRRALFGRTARGFLLHACSQQIPGRGDQIGTNCEVALSDVGLFPAKPS